MSTCYIGIDPGSKGAICILAPNSEPKFIDLTKPIGEVAEDCKSYMVRVTGSINVCIEDVHSLHGMSAKSNFNFGYNVGQINALLEILGHTPHKVTPKVWQAAIGVTVKGKEIKHNVAKLVTDKYPNAAIYGTRGGLKDGRSDALGIAIYLKELLNEDSTD